jgi:hypothetical protein
MVLLSVGLSVKFGWGPIGKAVDQIAREIKNLASR